LVRYEALKKRGAVSAPWGTPTLIGFSEEVDKP